MRQPQISDQGYLKPVLGLSNCHFGQLIHTCHVCMYCHGSEQLTCSYSNCPQQQLGARGNLKTRLSSRWLNRPMYSTMKLIFYDPRAQS
jgi:hypothetical protein